MNTDLRNTNIRTMLDTERKVILRTLAKQAVRTARNRGETKRWAVQLLFASFGDVATMNQCREQVDMDWVGRNCDG